MFSRRKGRRFNRGRICEVTSSSVIPELNLHTWLRAGYGYTLNGGDVATWTSQDPTNRTFSQGTAAQQPLYISADANFNGEDSVDFTGADAQRLVSDDAASTWTFMHDGSGCSQYIVWRSDGNAQNGSRLLATSLTAVGFALINEDEDTCRWLIRDEGGAVEVDLETSAASVPDATTVLSSMLFEDGVSPNDVVARCNGEDEAGDGTAFGTSAPETTCCLGARSNGTLAFTGQVAEIIIYDRRLTASEHAQVIAYLEAKFGITA